jgi:DNA excision repair protein ERCC-4
LTYDAASFHQFLETILATNAPALGSTRLNHSPWLFLDAAHSVFSTAKERVFSSSQTEMDDILTADEIPSDRTQGPEELPKWQVLKETLDEIEQETHLDPQHGLTVLAVC